MKIHLLILALFCFSMSFSQTNGYLPLDSGNVWIFNNNPYLKLESLGEELIEGITYKKVYDRIFYSGGTSYTLYLRIDGNKVYRYNQNDKTEKILYDFSVPADSTIYIDSSNYYIKCTENKMFPFYGKLVRQWKFEYGRECIDCQQEIVILDSIGWYMQGQAFATYWLTGGTIKGNPIITIVEGELSTNKNEDIGLFPNPFNSTAVIKFISPNAKYLRIVLFNVVGQQVRVIFDGITNKGINSFTLEGNNLASGMYLCQFRLSDKVVTKKVQIIK